MNRSRYSLFLLSLTACGCLGAAALRLYILRRCFEASGLLIRGSGALLGMMIFSGVWVLVTALLCRRLNPFPGTEEDFSPHPGWRVPEGAAALLVLVGTLMSLKGLDLKQDSFGAVVVIGGVLSFCCMSGILLVRGRLGEKGFWLSLLPVLFALARLIYHFRSWSRDPLVIDFAPRLLASITGVLALFFLTGYPLKVGRRRSTVFWALCCAVFTAMLIPDAVLRPGQTTLPDLLIWLGLCLWAGCGTLQILREQVQSSIPAQDAPGEQTLPQPGDADEAAGSETQL